MTTTFSTILIANRGEIALRVSRTLARLGVRSVAVYTDADRGAAHIGGSDVAVRIGSYLSIDEVVAAAVSAGAEAIHPGYGFLSENPALARACAAAGIVFIGPPPEAIEAMGDKIAAKATVAEAGVSVVPGSDGSGLSDERLSAAALDVGFPVLIKPSAGGGGKGMRLVERSADLPDAIRSARREALNSFGDDTLLMERFIADPRHIEIQILADTHGSIVHLGERECSLQRRHQKIVEEAPSPLLTASLRSRMGQQAVDAARACGYVGAGTVEFIVSGEHPDDFYFMEMNTRLQVEHPVTELVYDIDLVEEQVRVAAGGALSVDQASLEPVGHAIEARVYAEDPSRGFLPTGGTIGRFVAPSGDGVRVDAGIVDGMIIGSEFDPMLAKVIAWGPDRTTALARLRRALGDTAVLGITTNVGFLRRLLDVDDVRSGNLDTGLVDRCLDTLAPPTPYRAAVLAALVPIVDDLSAGDPWWGLPGWRLAGGARVRRRFDIGGHGSVEVGLTRSDATSGAGWLATFTDVEDADTDAEHADTDAEHADASVAVSLGRDGGAWRLTVDGEVCRAEVHRTDSSMSVAIEGDSWLVDCVVDRGTAGGAAAGGGDGVVRSPMPGTVLEISVAEGEQVAVGEPIAVVEAMKMEHALSAPIAGVVTSVHAGVGSSVALDAPLVTITPDD